MCRLLYILAFQEIGFCICSLFDTLRLQTDDDDVTVPLLSARSGRQNEEITGLPSLCSLTSLSIGRGIPLPMLPDCDIHPRSF
jgi:hypothetical protein